MKNNWQIARILLIGALLMLKFMPVAQAGTWVIAGYECSKKEHQETQTYGKKTIFGPNINDTGLYRLVTTTNKTEFYEPGENQAKGKRTTKVIN